MMIKGYYVTYQDGHRILHVGLTGSLAPVKTGSLDNAVFAGIV